MPHIEDKSKRVLNKLGRCPAWAKTRGEKTYQYYMQLVDALPKEPRFADYNIAIQRGLQEFWAELPFASKTEDSACVFCALLEFVRLHLSPYEDLAIKRNGRAESLPKTRGKKARAK